MLLAFDLISESLPVLTGFAAVVAAGLVVSLIVRRQIQKRFDAPRRTARDDGDDPGAADRRTSLRRDGQPVKVFLTTPTQPGGVQDAWVLDRSTGGLRVAVPMAIAAESYIQVRAENAPDNVPWISLIVRSCKSVNDHFELGCAFEQTPPWNVLLLFG